MDSEPLPLAPKCFDVSYLVRHAGRAVSREELRAAVWPDVAVNDASLTQAVFVIRRALGESEEGSGYLATVARAGYRFSADVRPIPRPETPAAVVPPPVAAARPGPAAGRGGAARRVRRGAIALVLLAAAVVAVR